jgi:hypothetical protein
MKRTLLFVLFVLALAVFTDSAIAASGKRFYVTQNSDFDGSQALQACATGFHMASLWEIYEVTELRYDRTLGFQNADSGFGPPSGVFGWVRTGWTPEVGGTGTANCDVWRSNNSGFSGTMIELPIDWENIELGNEIGSWHSGTAQCDFKTRVWCVQN